MVTLPASQKAERMVILTSREFGRSSAFWLALTLARVGKNLSFVC